MQEKNHSPRKSFHVMQQNAQTEAFALGHKMQCFRVEHKVINNNTNIDTAVEHCLFIVNCRTLDGDLCTVYMLYSQDCNNCL